MNFEELLAGAGAVDVAGWDFSWLDGRAAGAMVATESWPPNIHRAQQNLRGKGVVVAPRDRIQADGPFVACSRRFLIEARRVR